MGSCRSAVLGLAVAGVSAATAPLAAQEPEDISGPGPEHAVLASLVGEWRVSARGQGDRPIGSASAQLRLDGRFLEVEMSLEAGPIRHAVYTFGFDRRHGEFTVTAMDDTGTYGVTARGVRDDSRIAMYGTDDDPVMTRMGLTKEFVIVLEVPSADRFSIETLFIDTRTPERNEISFILYELRRAS